jgi:hypothetical protein
MAAPRGQPPVRTATHTATGGSSSDHFQSRGIVLARSITMASHA